MLTPMLTAREGQQFVNNYYLLSLLLNLFSNLQNTGHFKDLTILTDTKYYVKTKINGSIII